VIQNGIKWEITMEGNKRTHFLDLKIPIGGLLSFYGLLLVFYGLFTGKEVYQRSLGININLIWGIVMLIVGGAFLLSYFIKSGRLK
jgi:hypothetical protein